MIIPIDTYSNMSTPNDSYNGKENGNNLPNYFFESELVHSPPFFRLVTFTDNNKIANMIKSAYNLTSSSFQSFSQLEVISSPRMSSSPSPSSPTSPTSPTSPDSPTSSTSNNYSIRDAQKIVYPSHQKCSHSLCIYHNATSESLNQNLVNEKIESDSSVNENNDNQFKSDENSNFFPFNFFDSNDEMQLYHCHIEKKEDETYWICDFEDRGVFILNGKTVGRESTQLYHGDILIIKKLYLSDSDDADSTHKELDKYLHEAFVYQAILLPVKLNLLDNDISDIQSYNGIHTTLIGRKRKRDETELISNSSDQIDDKYKEDLFKDTDEFRNTQLAMNKLMSYMKEMSSNSLYKSYKRKLKINNLKDKVSSTVNKAKTLIDEQKKKFDNIINHDLTCTICKQIFLDPMTLGCSHSFCKSCLLKLIQTESENSKCCLCPLCRTFIGIQYPVRNIPMDSLTKNLIPILDENLRLQIQNRKREWTEHENKCKEHLENLLDIAQTRATSYMNIIEKWSEDAKKIFINGIRHFIGESRAKYCELVGMTESWIQTAPLNQMRRACENLYLKEPLRPETNDPGVYKIFEEDLRRLLYEFLKNETYSEEPFLYKRPSISKSNSTQEGINNDQEVIDLIDASDSIHSNEIRILYP